jgi:hypothetical protein
MKFRWFIPLITLLPGQTRASQSAVTGRITTIVINPSQITTLHLRPEFESSIRMPEEISSVILGSLGSFKAEHSEGEAEYVYVKPITELPSRSNLLISTKSGLHVTLELINDGVNGANQNQPVDFLIEYRAARSFFIPPGSGAPLKLAGVQEPKQQLQLASLKPPSSPNSALDNEYEQQQKVNAPVWTKWSGKQIETSLGDIRQWNNRIAVSYSILNGSDHPVEILPPQIQIAGRKVKKKNKKEGKELTSDQLEIQEYRLSTTRLEPGGRADGVLVYERPNFKQSTEKLLFQIAQADQVDQPLLIRLPFTPAIASNAH